MRHQTIAVLAAMLATGCTDVEVASGGGGIQEPEPGSTGPVGPAAAVSSSASTGAGTSFGTGQGTGGSTGSGSAVGSCPTPGESESICGLDVETGDRALNFCLGVQCCEEFSACMASGQEACVTCFIDQGGALCDAAISCLEQQCPTETSICDSKLTTDDAPYDACLEDACCAEFSACTTGGTDIEPCIACLDDGGGPLCDPLNACADASGCATAAHVCDSGYTTTDPAVDACLSDSCCDELSHCTACGTDIVGCYECFEAGGGPRCDAAIACRAASGCEG